MLLNIEHITHYQYPEPVQFGTHRLLLRPLEGHDVQIRSSSLVIEPTPRIRWIRDAFDNSIALADFKSTSQSLTIKSTAQLQQFNTNPFDFYISPEALELPLQYNPEEQNDVRAYLLRQYPGDHDAIAEWIRPFLGASGKAQTLDFLSAINQSVPRDFNYLQRHLIGVQSPATTLNSRSGTCRDFALLLMESARQLGLAARFVSGYLCRSHDAIANDTACDSTHAWAEIYLPGAGWKGFDPTAGILAADTHVRVAVTRAPEQAAPVSGGYIGKVSSPPLLTVTVNAHVLK